MAKRRMFSKDVTNSSEFLMMSVFTVMRMTESKPDDLQSLHQKGFIFVMDNKVCIVKDWHENNQLRADRYQQSKYLDDKKYRELYMISMEDKIKDIPMYNKLISEWQPNGNQRLPQDRIGKVRIGKVNTYNKADKSADKKVNYNPLGADIIKAFEEVDPKNKTYYGNKTQRSACDFLLKEYGLDETLKRVSILTKTNKLQYFPSITTPNELKERWVKLQDAVDRKRSETKTKSNYVL
jgi:hypothetical protein